MSKRHVVSEVAQIRRPFATVDSINEIRVYRIAEQGTEDAAGKTLLGLVKRASASCHPEVTVITADQLEEFERALQPMLDHWAI